MPKRISTWNRHMLVLAVVLGMALLLRLWGISDQSLWFDEGWSVHVAQQSLPEALRLPGSEGHTHPPGYYVALWAWVRLFGCSEAAVRSLSAIVGVIGIFFTYVLGKWLADAKTGLLSAALLSVNPAHIVYSQEARMYTMLCASLTALWALHVQLGKTHPHVRDWRFWGALVLAETCALYTHLYAFVAIAVMGVWAVGSLWRRNPTSERWAYLLPYLGCHALSLLLYAPVLQNTLGLAATHSTLDSVAPSLPAFAWETWAFWLGGHIALAGREPQFAMAAKAAAMAIVLLCFSIITQKQHRRVAVTLLGQIGATCAGVWALHQLRPGYHPRYLLMVLPLATTMLAYGIMALGRSHSGRGLVGKATALAIVAVIIVPQAMAYQNLQTDAYYRRDDARATSAVLAEHLPQGAPVLIDIEDWALQYYVSQYDLVLTMVDASVPVERVLETIEDAIAGRAVVGQVGWHQGTTDMRGLVGFALERTGHQQQRIPLSGYSIALYDHTSRGAELVESQAKPSWGVIQLTDAICDSAVPASDALAVAMQWTVRGQLPADLKVALQVRDIRGRIVATLNELLRDRAGQRTHAWAQGQTVWSFARIPLPEGLAPGQYKMDVVLYSEELTQGLDVVDESSAPAGKSAEILTTVLSKPQVDPAQPHLELPEGAVRLDKVAARDLVLVGYRMASTVLDSGTNATIELWWRGEGALPDHVIDLSIIRKGQVLAANTNKPVYGQYPTYRWQVGQTVHEYRGILLAPETPSGDATLQVSVDQGQPIALTSVYVSSVPRSYVRPDTQTSLETTFGSFAALVGYDIQATTVSTASSVPVTLYWHGLDAANVPYVVFVHILDDTGRLIAQHDGMPANGQRPTTGWALGEYLTDMHEVAWVVADYTGAAHVEVGLYDPTTGARVAMQDGASALLLPTALEVEPLNQD